MGYTTEFRGQFQLDRPLAPEHRTYLIMFASTRRMRRSEFKVRQLEDPVREAVGLPVGPQGCYFVGGGGFAGQDEDASVSDANQPPDDQPGLWCQWVPTEDGAGIEWDGGEKFYSYVEWLEYLIAHFLAPWGYRLNGRVRWRGEEFDDIGTIVVEDNEVSTEEA